MLVEARVPVTRCTSGSTTLPACRRWSASRSPEYNSEEEEVDEDEEEDEEEEEEEEVVGVPCCLSRGEADRGGDKGSAEEALDGGAKLAALEAEDGAELPL